MKYPPTMEYNHHHIRTADTLHNLAYSLLSEIEKDDEKQNPQKIIRKLADLMNFVTRITEKGGQLDQRGDLYNALTNAKGPFADKKNKVPPTKFIKEITHNCLEIYETESWMALNQILQQPDAQKLTCQLAEQLIEVAQELYPRPIIGFFKTKLNDDEIAKVTELKKTAQNLLKSPQNADKAAALLTTLQRVIAELNGAKL